MKRVWACVVAVTVAVMAMGMGALPANAVVTNWVPVQAPLSGTGPYVSSPQTINGVAVTVTAGYNGTYPPGFKSYYSTRSTGAGVGTSVVWSFSSLVPTVRLSYGYVGMGASDPELFEYSTDGSNFLPIDFTGSNVVSTEGGIEGAGQPLGILGADGTVRGTPGDASGYVVLAFGSGVKAIRATTAAGSSGDRINIVGLSLSNDPPSTLTYNANGATAGSAPVDATSYPSGGFALVAGNSGNLAKDGYRFVGWSRSAAGDAPILTSGNSVSVTTGTTLFAAWEALPPAPPPPPTPPTITLTFDPQGGACGTGTVSGFASSWVPLANDCRRSGWTLAGWAHQGGVQTADFAADQQVQLTESTTLYAVWKRVIVPTPDAPAATPPTPPDGVTAPPTEAGEVLDVPALPASIVVISVPAATPVDQLATSCGEAGLRFAVGFRPLDATLKRTARAWIRANAPIAGCRYVVKGYVQPVGATGNDTSLSAARARAMASAINAAPGSMTVNANRRQTAAACARFENRCVIVGVFGN